MKILIDARFYGLENAGLGRYTMNLVEQLSLIDNINEYIILLRTKYFDQLKFPSNFKTVKADIAHYSLKEQLFLKKLIKNYNPDLVHFLHFNVPLNFRGNFVITIHDLIMHKFWGREATTLPFFIYPFKRLAYKSIFANSVKKASHIIVPSNFTKQELIKCYSLTKPKVTVIYEGVEDRVQTIKSRSSVLEKYNIDSPYFIYTGNAYPHKNLKRAVEAISELNTSSHQKILLLIASGRGVFTQRLQKLVKKTGAEKYVLTLGFVPDKDLFILYKNSVGYLYPSLYEGFGLPGLEAITAGTLLLASDIPVFHEVYKSHALYFNPFDFSSIVSTMKDALEMELKKRHKLITESREFVKAYSWRKMAEQTIKVYEDSISLR